MARELITIGTRGSALALTQANWTADRLKAAYDDLDVELLIIKTKGDKILDVPLAKVGGKGLFVKEIEDALLDGRADLAVHSMKDVPTELPEGLFIATIPEREDCRDVLIGKNGESLEELERGARVGTSSLRRQAQLLIQRPDLEIISLRGNLDTRLKKLHTENLDAIILAAAGLNRMGMMNEGCHPLDPELMIPAIAQGALGLEARKGDSRILDKIAFLHHEPTAVCVSAERAFLRTMEGGCQAPLAANCLLKDGRISITGLVADTEGKRVFRDSMTGESVEAAKIGSELAGELLERGGREVIAELYGREQSQ